MNTCHNQTIREMNKETFRLRIATVSSSAKAKMILQR